MSGVVYREGGPLLPLDALEARRPLRLRRRPAPSHVPFEGLTPLPMDPRPLAAIADVRANLERERSALLTECARLTDLVGEGLARAVEIDFQLGAVRE